MLKWIGIGVGVLVVGFLVVVALQPSSFRIERSQKMDAPPFVVFNIVNDFKRWPSWSPWEKLDPNMEKKHTGPDVGVGSVYEWAGNDQVGTGRMTIEESVPEKRIAIELEFLKPWEATNETSFTFTRDGDGVEVNWAMAGENNFMAKAASLFMNMDEMVGGDFEKGLAQLQKIAEAEAKEVAKQREAKAKQAAQEAARAKAAQAEKQEVGEAAAAAE
jgi:uncharacterized protein YndB with AHSA1/START domain